MKKGRSWVWSHFGTNHILNKVTCYHCNREFSTSTSTGSLKTHLVGTHDIRPDNEISKIAQESSWVWQHFEPFPENNKVKCKQCDREFSISTSTGTLGSHLDKTHNLGPDGVSNVARRYFLPRNT